MSVVAPMQAECSIGSPKATITGKENTAPCVVGNTPRAPPVKKPLTGYAKKQAELVPNAAVVEKLIAAKLLTSNKDDVNLSLIISVMKVQYLFK